MLAIETPTRIQGARWTTHEGTMWMPAGTETPEQTIPPTGFKGRDFQVCMTMNDTWSYKQHDQNWKPKTDLIRNLVDVASKGGNFLLQTTLLLAPLAALHAGRNLPGVPESVKLRAGFFQALETFGAMASNDWN